MKNLDLNVLKIKDEVEIVDIREIILQQMNNKNERNKFSKEIINGQEKYNLEFFFYMNENFSQKIGWYEEIKELFHEDDEITKSVFSGYGILLIYNDKLKYAITFGRANYIIAEYIDWNYGLIMASKMLNPSEINAQSSKFFSLSKNKSLVIYNSGNFNTESGESVDYIEANIEEVSGGKSITEILNIINKKVTFSGSLKIICKGEDLTLNRICSLIYYLNNVLEKYNSRVNIPKLNFLSPTKDIELIYRLQEKLKTEIMQDNNQCNISLGLYTVLDSEIMIMDQITKYSLIYKRKPEDYENLTIEDIKDFICVHQVTDLNQLNLKLESSGFHKYCNILKIIDYTTELEGISGHFCLYDGKWAKFNQDYVRKIEEDFNNKINKLTEFDSSFDFNVEKNEEFVQSNYEEMLKYLNQDDLTLNEETKKKLYGEFTYNFRIAKENGAIIRDRKRLGNNVNIEVCDIYHHTNKELIHTKIGTPGDFNECINQSIGGVEFWANNKATVKQELEIDDVSKVTLLLLITNITVLETKDLSQFRSLRFKLNMLDWYNRVERLNLIPRVIIGAK